MIALRSFRSVLLILLALFALALTPAFGAEPATPPADHEAHHDSTPVADQTVIPDTTPSSGSMMEIQEFDLMFIDMMILHHQGAIAMAEVTLERSEHQELLSLAQQIIDTQQGEIEQLQAWRAEWYPDAPEMSMDQNQMMGGMGGMGQMMDGMPGMQEMAGMMGMGMMEPEAAADALRTTSESFDLAFLNAMIPHHLMALMMAEMAVQHATLPDLADLAESMIEMQEAEIAQMREWRAAW